MVTKVGDYGTRKTILIGQESYYIALPVKVSGTANTVIKAGQPLVGDLTVRDTAFTAGTENAVGANLHDVKLDADGKGNATIVIAGCIDLLKLDAAVATALQTAAIDKIILVKGSAI
jgi:hypothetical protein